MPTPAELLVVCEAAARAGAGELMAWQGRFRIREKGLHDLVTDADLASEQAVRRVIAQTYPDHGILAEESAAADALERPYCWVVDPLDGTINYAHQLPCYAVSVAVGHRGQLQAAVVYDPSRDECFAAARGEGARLNGTPITPSNATEIGSALLAVSFPAQLTCESRDLQAFLKIAPMCQAMRRTGSAALNLAYVACGRLDGHWAHDIYPWDAAAGILLIQEAGGVATARDGGPFDLARGDYLSASTAALHASLLPLVNCREGD